MGRFVTLKKFRSKKKPGAKKPGCCYSKREESIWPLLFLNNNDPVFLHPAFFWTWVFFQFQTLKKYQVDLIN
jgi:hypothetical protein